MACSKHQGNLMKDPPEVREGEPVLIFRGPKVSRAQCVQVTVQNKLVRYLVRYPRATERDGAAAAAAAAAARAQGPPREPPAAPEIGATLKGPQALEPAPSSLPACSIPSTSTAGPAPSSPKTGPSSSRGGGGGSGSSSGGSSPRPSRRRTRGRHHRRGGSGCRRQSSSSSSSSKSSSCTCSSCSCHSGSCSSCGGSYSTSGSSCLEVAVPLWCPGGVGSSSGGSSTSGGGSSTSGGGSSTSGLVPQPPTHSRVKGKEGLPSVVVVGDWEYEWVPEGRVLRFSFTHVQDRDAALQMAAKKAQQEECPVTSTGGNDEANVPKGSGRGSGGSAAGSSSSSAGGSSWWGAVMQWPRKRKRGRARKRERRGEEPEAVDPEEEYLNRLEEVQLHLPKALKPLLVEDWELVTLGKKLFTLPARKPVAAILEEYAAFQKNYGTATKKLAVTELLAGLQEYFDMVLGPQLLYNFERPQHAEILATYPTTQMSLIYGGAHLLRLFPQMGPMLACTPLNDSSIEVLRNHLQDFLQYLATEPSRLFTVPSDYQEASPDYQQKVE